MCKDKKTANDTLGRFNETTPGDGLGAFLGISESGEYLRDDDKNHLLAIGPTRSGKGVGIIIPSLLYWQGSTIILDINGENYEETAGWRKEKMNNIVLKFKPTEENSARYNPLDEIRKGTPREVQDTQNIVMYFVDPTGKGSTGAEAHLIQSAASLMTGIILHLLYTLERPSIKDVLTFIGSKKYGTVNFLQEKIQEILQHNKFENCLSDDVEEIFTKIGNFPKQKFDSIVSILNTALDVYRDPIIADNFSASDFSVNDLMHNDKPVSLYLIVPSADMERIMPIYRLIIELAYKINAEKFLLIDYENYKNKLLIILDEVTALEEMDLLKKDLGYIAFCGIKVVITTQNINQLYKKYPKYTNDILKNCKTKIYLSSVSIAEDEFLSNDSMIFVAGKPPIRAKKIRWYDDSHFITRKLPSSPTDRILYIKNKGSKKIWNENIEKS